MGLGFNLAAGAGPEGGADTGAAVGTAAGRLAGAGTTGAGNTEAGGGATGAGGGTGTGAGAEIRLVPATGTVTDSGRRGRGGRAGTDWCSTSHCICRGVWAGTVKAAPIARKPRMDATFPNCRLRASNDTASEWETARDMTFRAIRW